MCYLEWGSCDLAGSQRNAADIKMFWPCSNFLKATHHVLRRFVWLLIQIEVTIDLHQIFLQSFALWLHLGLNVFKTKSFLMLFLIQMKCDFCFTGGRKLFGHTDNRILVTLNQDLQFLLD